MISRVCGSVNMVRFITNNQASVSAKSGRPLGTGLTLVLMVGLCVPFAWYVHWLDARYGAAMPLNELPAIELLVSGVLLGLPFVVLRLLRVKWHTER